MELLSYYTVNTVCTLVLTTTIKLLYYYDTVLLYCLMPGTTTYQVPRTTTYQAVAHSTTLELFHLIRCTPKIAHIRGIQAEPNARANQLLPNNPTIWPRHPRWLVLEE